MTSEGYFQRMLLPPKFILYNLFYYFFGRFNGLTWYFFPAVLALLLFIGGEKRPWRWLVFAALAVEILIYIILMPTNFGGGGGSLANRYFVHIFPLFFFLPAVRLKARHLALAWGMAAKTFPAPCIFVKCIVILSQAGCPSNILGVDDSNGVGITGKVGSRRGHD